MNTILFFDRSPLTLLYAKMTPYMNGVDCIHVAYSQKDVNILAAYNIKPDYIYLEMFKQEYDNIKYSDVEIQCIDKVIIDNTRGRFNLNGAIQSDRGFTLLSYEECLKSSVTHYRIWEKIFKEHHVDLMLHEPCSLFFNFIGCILCKKQGGTYTFQVDALSDKWDFAYMNSNNDDNDYLEIRRRYHEYKNNPNAIEEERCRNFLNEYRENQSVLFAGLLNRKTSSIKLLFNAIKTAVYKRIKIDKSERIYNNINYWIAVNNLPWEKFKNIIGYKWNKIKFVNEVPEGEKFFFYPIHLEPEAAILYIGDGIYKNQIKLIENIAASLPAGYFLYVKDHPHEYAYRSADDYKRLLQVPNIRLLNQWIPAKVVMNKAVGVITINGTAGFEATMLNKQVYCFGENQYSFVDRNHYVRNIRDLKPEIYEHINDKLEDDKDLYAYVMAYLESMHPGYTSCYTGSAFIEGHDYDGDARKLATNMVNYIDYIKPLNDEKSSNSYNSSALF